MKNIMFAQFKHEVGYGRFKYPNKDIFLKTAGLEMNGFYHKMVGEWRDLESEQRLGVNKRIEAPSGGHDDVCCADALANFAALYGNRVRSNMPKASKARIRNVY